MIVTKKCLTIHRIQRSIARLPALLPLILAKICSASFYRSTYCTLCFINFMLLVNVMATPLWLRHDYVDGYFVFGLWAICNHQLECDDVFLPVNEYLHVVRLLLILALISDFIALFLSWELLTRVLKKVVSESLLSSVAHFSAGFFLLCSLVVTYCKLAIEVDSDGTHAAPYLGFFAGCFACSLCFLLGTLSLLQHRRWFFGNKIMKI
ncbi:uncharacterized protein LOC128418476 isoform X2 [Podarcis raffonei]|uniref:uncharacterized protein LOC128418476 isoform X2 n=1 Tax=Podarcis raffonei TaxID=65483 RepID=UPI0023298482|nr:uncharacterized protein LOC128418476 isoform X2 [Podarcis raffonei]